MSVAARGRIVVIGGLNIDLHLFGLHRSGGQALQVAERYLVEPGGKGANVARAAARLGADVAVVGRVGADDFGRLALETATADGVDTRFVTMSERAATGFVAIELDGGHHRSLIFAPGANDELSIEVAGPALDDLGDGDVVVVQAEVPSDLLAAVLDRCAASRATVLLDPTPPEAVSRTALGSADVVTPDLEEAAALTGRVASSRVWPELAARDLLTLGARRVALKLGPSGTLFADDAGLTRVPTLEVTASDETGAGDVFLAALAVARVERRRWVEAVRFANAASALSVEREGLHLPLRTEVDDALGRIVGADDPLRGF